MIIKNLNKNILLTLTLTLFLSMFSLIEFTASAVNKTEVESNNRHANATVTYDDYNNYGVISSTTDIDWW